MTIVFQDQTTDIVTEERDDAGQKSFQVVGSFAGATVTIETNQDNIGFSPAFVFTEPLTQNGFIKAGVLTRFVITGATGSTNLTASVI